MKPRRPNPLWFLVVNATYALAALVGWPYYLFLLVTRRKYRHRCWQRWGLVPKSRRAPGGRFWVHAISVGEVEAARTFVPALAEAFPQADIVLSTTTMTGYERARKLFPGRTVFHFPLDLWPCAAAALARVRPTAVVQVESEWWPNFFLMARRRGIPLVCVNVRITERGARGYRRIGRLMRAVFNTASAIGVQAPVYAERFLALGVDADRLCVTGQMKHDGVTFADTAAGAEDLRRDVGIDAGDLVVVAGSTAPGEETPILAAYGEARRAYPRLRLVLVPRRPENFDAAADAVTAAGLGVVRRSKTAEWQGSKLLPPVILGDTMGELMKWYALADIVFVGRSFVPLGGSNPMEPGSLARPLVWGPEMFNFPVEAAALVEAGAAREVLDAADLAAAIVDLLTHRERRRQMGEAARQTIRGMQGATRRTIDLVREALDAGPPARGRPAGRAGRTHA
ncbi:MAG: 3-deoxy-D-manno-octulosonic acid transferase [Planctomycetes bacterium]|nr:3-deoxy-D-manno-octulosonic acid transferase [Planctomycetota bacterium]